MSATRPFRWVVGLGVLAALAGWLVLSAVPAWAHAQLEGTKPERGSTVEQAPPAVELRFSEPVEPDFAQVQAFDPDGERVDAGQPRVEGTRFIQPLEELTEPGTYAVLFRVLSADGHPVESRFTFDFAPPEPEPAPDPTPAATPTPRPTPSPTATETAAHPSPGQPDTESPAETAGAGPSDLALQDAGPVTAAGLWVARLLNYLSLAAVVGLLLTAAYLLPGKDPGNPGPAPVRTVTRRAGVVGLLWVASIAALFLFGVSSVAAEPIGRLGDPGMLPRFAATRFGGTILVQGVLALAIAAGAFAARGVPAARGLLATALLAGACPAWWGHAGTSQIPVLGVLNDWGHVMAASLWAGGLAVLVLASLGRFGQVELAAPTARFSGIAGWALAAILVTGTVNALLGVAAVEQLWQTQWGRLVLIKAALFTGIAWLGWQNRRRLVPRLRRGGDAAEIKILFRRVATAEVALMLLAFGAAGTMASSVPADAEAAARVQSVVTDFGDGQLNLSLDPAEPGTNVVHLYFFDAQGRSWEVQEPTVTLVSGATTVDASLLKAGPGHYSALGVTIPETGQYRVEVHAVVDGERVAASGAVDLR